MTRPRIVLLAHSVVMIICLDACRAGEIGWVDFSSYAPGSIAQTGLHSADGLVLDASFSTLTNMRSGLPGAGTATLNDPAWPFSNRDISTLGVISDISSGLVPLRTDLTFTFTNPGGLPAGGSLGIFDLELRGSSVQLVGFRSGSEVSVGWTVAFYQVDGVNVAPPMFDPATNTLSGSGEIYPTVNNFTFLSSDVQLDAVVLMITAAPDDGIRFAVSRASVPVSAVPEPSAFALIGLGMIIVRFGNRSNRSQ